jgi:hypothetical protein
MWDVTVLSWIGSTSFSDGFVTDLLVYSPPFSMHNYSQSLLQTSERVMRVGTWHETRHLIAQLFGWWQHLSGAAANEHWWHLRWPYSPYRATSIRFITSQFISWLQTQRSVFDSRHYQIFWEVLSLERGPLSLVSTIEELLGRKNSDSGLEDRDYGPRDSPRWAGDTLHTQQFLLSSPTSGGRSVGIVRSRTKATELLL